MCGYFGPKLAGWLGEQAGPPPTKKGYTIEEKTLLQVTLKLWAYL